MVGVLGIGQICLCVKRSPERSIELSPLELVRIEKKKRTKKKSNLSGSLSAICLWFSVDFFSSSFQFGVISLAEQMG